MKDERWNRTKVPNFKKNLLVIILFEKLSSFDALSISSYFRMI